LESQIKILIACEFSQVVCKAFRLKGHEVYSCDILPAEGGHPEWHIQDDVLKHLDDGWDMMIAHPPCTYLTCAANRSFKNNPDRWQNRVDAMIFVKKLFDANINKIAIENPVGVISTYLRKPDQYIQPYQFGHPDSKKTGIWLKNLTLLNPTKIVEPEWIYPLTGSGKRMSKTHAKNGHSGLNLRKSAIRSKTYQGIADAMARTWG
jgi:hypothetical protein